MRAALPLLLVALALSGCKDAKRQTALDTANNRLADGVATPEGQALKAAIRVDPARAGRSTPAAAPAAAAGPTCLERLADRLAYADDWARRLPAGFALPAGARVAEAAGRDAAPCAVRVVSVTMPGDREAAAAAWEKAAHAAGYDAGRTQRGGDLVVAGTSGDAAYVAMIGTSKGGTVPVDWVWSKGG